MKNHVFILLVFIIFMFPVSLSAQEGYDDVSPGVKGLVIGSQVDNSYSALVINGPNQGYYPDIWRDIVFKFRAGGKSVIRASRSTSWGSYLQFLTTSPRSTDATPIVRMHIDEDGHVGIGTTNPSHTLSVNGTVRAKEVIVNTGWADFVFDKDYQLPTLEEVKTHINAKGTLPGVPSESEVKANGLNLSEANVLLLQKIEELTLYTIQQQELIESLNSRINKLESNK